MRVTIRFVAFCLVMAPAFVLAQNAPAPVRQAGERTVTVAAIPGVVAAGAVWTRAWQGTDNADGILGMSDGSLLFAQEQPNRVRKLAPDDSVSVFSEDTHGSGSLTMDRQGRVIAAQRTCTDPGRQGAPCTEPTAIGVIYPERDRRTLASAYQGASLGRVNDLIVAASGGVYFTSGGAYYVAPDGRVSQVGANLRTNGVMLSRDERMLFVTNGSTVVVFDLQADGTAVNQRDFATLGAGGNGDGLAIDADGRLYVTSAPGVQVFSADGAYLGLIPTPRSVISVAFAGPEKKTLYVVGSGAQNADGSEFATPEGVRNNAKTIYRIPLIAQGFSARAK